AQLGGPRKALSGKDQCPPNDPALQSGVAPPIDVLGSSDASRAPMLKNPASRLWMVRLSSNSRVNRTFLGTPVVPVERTMQIGSLGWRLRGGSAWARKARMILRKPVPTRIQSIVGSIGSA